MTCGGVDHKWKAYRGYADKSRKIIDETEGQEMAPKLDPEDARQGEKTGHMRYVLVVSTVVAAIALMSLFFIYS